MVKILNNQQNIITYECDCGVKGKCMIKPQEKDAAIVVDVRCPVCLDAERIVLVQYENEDDKFKIMENLNESNLSWSSIISNEIIEYFSNGEEND